MLVFYFDLIVFEQTFVTCVQDRKTVREEDQVEVFTVMALRVRAAVRYGEFLSFPCLSHGSLLLEATHLPFPSPRSQEFLSEK